MNPILRASFHENQTAGRGDRAKKKGSLVMIIEKARNAFT